MDVAAVTFIPRKPFQTPAEAWLGLVDVGGDLRIFVHVRVVHRNKPAGAHPTEVDALRVDVVRVAHLHGLAEIAHGRAAVVHPTPHSLDKRGLEVEQIVNPQAVAEGRRHIPHARQVLAQRDHVQPVVAASQEKSAVGHQNQGPQFVGLLARGVHVGHELFRQEHRVDVLAIGQVVVHVEAVEGPGVAVAVSVAIALA